MIKVIINPDPEYAAEIKRQIKDNNGYCPCEIEKTKDTKCKCAAFRKQVQDGIPGECNCGLYIAVEEQ